jgi:pimeloyl-ACP methyl ester carboxylesterase
MPTFVTSDGATLHYAVHDFTDRWRKAGTIILVHGFARSGEFWFNMIPYLALVLPGDLSRSARAWAIAAAGRSAPRDLA